MSKLRFHMVLIKWHPCRDHSSSEEQSPYTADSNIITSSRNYDLQMIVSNDIPLIRDF